MTTFDRRGHWRTSKYGVTHWVSGHHVDREDWHHEGGSSYSNAISNLTELKADKTYTARYVYPNAICPVCGESVFFYRNEYGSRVFFDELGPPWPKHPCTDQSDLERRSKKSSRKRTLPQLREKIEIDWIDSLRTQAVWGVPASFKYMYGHKPWKPWILKNIIRNEGSTFLILSSADFSSTRPLILKLERRPSGLSEYDLVFYSRGEIEYLRARTLKVASVEAEKMSARTFVSRLLCE